MMAEEEIVEGTPAWPEGLSLFSLKFNGKENVAPKLLMFEENTSKMDGEFFLVFASSPSLLF